VSALVLGACQGSAEITIENGDGGTEIEASGFIEGLVDGFISPFTGLASLFDSGVDVYEDNRGSGYTLGFVIGLVLIILLLMGLFTGGRRYYTRRV
jgi:hypothetical protein